MSKPRRKVAILDKQFTDVEYILDIETGVLKDEADVECYEAFSAAEIPSHKVAEVEGVLAWHHITKIDRDLLEKMTNTKILVRIGMGYDNIDLKVAAELGIRVCNVPDYGVEEVADSAMCLLLNIMRKTYWLANGTKQGLWNTKDALGATRLNGRTMGIIGMGRIGTATALRAKAFSLSVIYYDPFIEYGRAKALGVNQVESLEELLKRSDIVSVHCPLKHHDHSNHHLLNKDNLKWMKKGSVLINTARGSVIEEDALVNALKDGTISAAGLDVFEKEPYLSGPLLELPNVIMTPHSAFYSDQGLVEMRTKAAMEVLRVLQGKEPLYCVNKEYLKTPR